MSTFKTSTIRLYQATSSSNWELLPHKLFIVDDIESYLATKTFNTYTLVQYQKPTLELSIVLDLSQTYAEPLNSGFKYARIENSDDSGHYYYYFIKSIDWRAKSAVRFNLVMDVLNTFKEGTHYSFKDSTKISREHKDRFIIKPNNILIFEDLQLTSYDGTVEGTSCVIRNENAETICTGTVSDVDQYGFTLTIDVGYDTTELKAIFDNMIDTNEDIEIYVSNNDYHIYNSGDGTCSYDQYQCYRNIDYVAENINPILQCGNSEGKLIENKKTLLADDWYLLYRNTNNPDPTEYVNPVECYIIPATSKAVSTGVITSGQIKPSSLELGQLYYIPLHVVGSATPDLDALAYSQTVTLSNGTTLGTTTGSNDFSYIVIAKTTDGYIECSYNYVSYNPAEDYFELIEQRIYGMLSYITINQDPTYYSKSNVVGLDLHTLFETNLDADNRSEFSYNSTGETLSSIDVLDRTDAKNIKLIKLPYVPYNFTITSNKIDITASNWNYTDLEQANHNHLKVLKLNDLSSKLNNEINSSYLGEHPLRNLYRGSLISVDPKNTDLRSINNESKLFNSEFYKPTYVYDSFQYAVQLEKCDLSYYISNGYTTFYIDFDVTRTINSKFMFTFKSLHLRNATESYAKYMPIARNNEEVLYNVPYINYVRTGYNYDIKAKNRSTFNAWAGVGAAGLGLAASLVLPSAPMKALGIVTSLISMAMTVKNAVNTTMQNEENMSRKLKEAEMQTASVSGSDDVDLMSVYAENRLKYLVYEPNDIMKNMLYNLFFFAGYNSQRMGLPSHNTRLNFDYLECDAVINKIANIPDDCLTELVNAFKYGVTYIHKTKRTTDKWDFDQKYENWEKSLGVE